MNKRNFLRMNVVSTLKCAYELKAKKNYSVKDCSVKDFIDVVTEKSNNSYMSNNGGDYTYTVKLVQVSPCIFKVEEDWSCDIAPIENYNNYNGYIVLSKKELENFLTLSSNK